MSLIKLLLNALPTGLLVMAGGFLALAHAQGNVPPMDEKSLRSYVEQQVTSLWGAKITRLEVTLGQLDARVTLTPCARTEPFTPQGGRFWGRSSVGLRCAEGAHWSVLVPVTTTVWGLAMVAASPLSHGTVLSDQDVQEKEIELSRERGDVARTAEGLVGRTLLRSVLPGQPLRTDMVRITNVVNAGDQVRLRIQGTGFSVTSGGQALSSAGDGQSVRVRTDLGKILTGTARAGQMVDVRL